DPKVPARYIRPETPEKSFRAQPMREACFRVEASRVSADRSVRAQTPRRGDKDSRVETPSIPLCAALFFGRDTLRQTFANSLIPLKEKHHTNPRILGTQSISHRSSN